MIVGTPPEGPGAPGRRASSQQPNLPLAPVSHCPGARSG